MARARGSSATRRLDAAGVDALLQQAGGAADPIVAVVGPDEALHRLAMRALLDAAADTDWVVHRVSARDPGAASVIRQACQPTLFGEESWLFATELEAGTDDALEALREVLPQASEEARLVLGHSGVARGRGVITAAQKAGAQLIEVRPVQASALPAVLSAHARRIGKVLPTEAAKAIVDSAGPDLSALLATVDQLASDAPTQLIDLDLVRATLVSSGTENQFEMADLVWRRQTSQALVAFRQLAERNGASAACVTGGGSTVLLAADVGAIRGRAAVRLASGRSRRPSASPPGRWMFSQRRPGYGSRRNLRPRRSCWRTLTPTARVAWAKQAHWTRSRSCTGWSA